MPGYAGKEANLKRTGQARLVETADVATQCQNPATSKQQEEEGRLCRRLLAGLRLEAGGFGQGFLRESPSTSGPSASQQGGSYECEQAMEPVVGAVHWLYSYPETAQRLLKIAAERSAQSPSQQITALPIASCGPTPPDEARLKASAASFSLSSPSPR